MKRKRKRRCKCSYSETEKCKKLSDDGEIMNEQYFLILDFYTKQWIHRDNGYWTKTLTMFFATLIVSVLPFFEPFELRIPNEIPRVLFPLLGVVLGAFSLYFSLSLADRVSLIGNKIETICERFPKGLKWRDGVNNCKFVSTRIIKKLSVTMFSLLFALDLYLIVCSFSTFSCNYGENISTIKVVLEGSCWWKEGYYV